MGKGATGPDARSRVLEGSLSKRIYAMPHFMRLSREAISNGAFQSGRDALPRAPWICVLVFLG
jgi:hypothetical protein